MEAEILAKQKKKKYIYIYMASVQILRFTITNKTRNR